jgi:hypothetical protein
MSPFPTRTLPAAMDIWVALLEYHSQDSAINLSNLKFLNISIANTAKKVVEVSVSISITPKRIAGLAVWLFYLLVVAAGALLTVLIIILLVVCTREVIRLSKEISET